MARSCVVVAPCVRRRRPRPACAACASIASASAATPSRCRRRRAHDAHLPFAPAAQAQHVAQAALCVERERRVAFVHRQDVGDLQDARLDRLHVVAQPGGTHDHLGVGEPCDLDLGLSRPDRLDDDRVEPRGVEDVDDLAGLARDAPEMASRGHRADEHAVVGAVLAHADAVSQHRAAGHRARRVDRNDADPPAAGEPLAEQRVDERRLARARRTGDADHLRPADVPRQPRAQRAARGTLDLHGRDRPRDRAPVAGEDRGEEGVLRRVHRPRPPPARVRIRAPCAAARRSRRACSPPRPPRPPCRTRSRADRVRPRRARRVPCGWQPRSAPP